LQGSDRSPQEVNIELSEKAQKFLIASLPAPPSVGTGAGRQGAGIDYTDSRDIGKADESV
jgi:hypothetical protein